MAKDNLQTFFCTWVTGLSGLQAPPEDVLLEPLLLRQFEGAKPWNMNWRITTF